MDFQANDLLEDVKNSPLVSDSQTVSETEGSTMKRILAFAAVASVVMLVPASAFAGFVVSVTGSGSLIAPPPDSSPGALLSSSVSVWEESSGSIVSDLAVDHNGSAGSFKGNDDFSALNTTLTAGTGYNSTMIHLDPLDRAIGSAKAVVTFSTKIIGIALFGTAVDLSDIYGAPGTTYPTGLVPTAGLDTRGIDFRANDSFSISADGKVLSLHFTANGAGFDQVRVFTAGESRTNGVPEPASLAVWSILGMTAGGSWWRKRKTA